MKFMNLFKLINIFYELRRGLRGHLAAYNSRSLVARGSLLVALLFAIPAFAAQSAYDLMERANALYRDGKFKQAIMLYRKAESRGADPVATSFNIANSYYQLENLPEATIYSQDLCIVATSINSLDLCSHLDRNCV